MLSNRANEALDSIASSIAEEALPEVRRAIMRAIAEYGVGPEFARSIMRDEGETNVFYASEILATRVGYAMTQLLEERLLEG